MLHVVSGWLVKQFHLLSAGLRLGQRSAAVYWMLQQCQLPHLLFKHL